MDRARSSLFQALACNANISAMLRGRRASVVKTNAFLSSLSHRAHARPGWPARAAREPIRQSRKAMRGRIEIAVDAAVLPRLNQGRGDVDVGKREIVAKQIGSMA